MQRSELGKKDVRGIHRFSMTWSQRKSLPLAAVPGMAVVLGGCGLLGSEALQALLSQAELSIQGSKPAGSVIDAISGGRIGLRDLSRGFASPGASRSALLEGDPQVALPVLGDDGTQVGTLTLEDARVVLREIKVKTVGGLESEDESDSTGRVAMAGDSEDESASEDESEDESESEDEDGDASVNADGETEAEFTGPFVVNLLADTVSPDLSSLEIPVGIYKEVSMKIAKLEDEDAQPLIDAGTLTEGDSLLSNSITLTGVYDPLTPSDTSDDVVFTFSHDVDEEFELHADELENGGIDVSEGAISSIVIAFRMAKWFDFTGSGIDFASVAASGLQLDSSASGDASELRSLIKEAIKSSADWGKDEDGDGRLESDEDSDHEDAEELEQEDEGEDD